MIWWNPEGIWTWINRAEIQQRTYSSMIPSNVILYFEGLDRLLLNTVLKDMFHWRNIFTVQKLNEIRGWKSQNRWIHLIILLARMNVNKIRRLLFTSFIVSLVINAQHTAIPITLDHFYKYQMKLGFNLISIKSSS